MRVYEVERVESKFLSTILNFHQLFALGQTKGYAVSIYCQMPIGKKGWKKSRKESRIRSNENTGANKDIRSDARFTHEIRITGLNFGQTYCKKDITCDVLKIKFSSDDIFNTNILPVFR